MIIDRLILGNLQTNCYILADEQTKECAVFDPAAEAGRIIAAIEKRNLKVKYIILTHVHIDHIMALDELKDLTGAQIVASTAEAELLNDNMGTLAELFSTVPPCSKADITVSDGDALCLGKSEMKFILTPGHTIGGMCILCGDILISGDTLFASSVGRTDFPGGSHSQLISSINDKLMKLDDNVQVYPGHGMPTTIGDERVGNPFI
ncbi:MAG: MBL fold metallo-hydrolase [Clostridia bacterium]|nr:MBL fold metallo-hydrolase [Clostridia bacterium]